MAPMIFAKAIVEGRPIDVFNEGRHSRDFTYVDDIAEGVIRAADQPAAPDPAWGPADPDPATSNAPFRLYNIGNGSPVALLDFIAALEAALGRKAIRELAPLPARRRARHLRRHQPARGRDRLAARHPGRGGGAPLRRTSTPPGIWTTTRTVAAAGVNPLGHYELYGRGEGRPTRDRISVPALTTKP